MSIRERLLQYLRRYPRLFRTLQAAKAVLFRLVPAYVNNDRDAKNHVLCLISSLLGLERSLGKPIVLTIEPTNICDQKCTVCETGLGILDRKPQKMSFGQFKRILDQFDTRLKKVYFYFMGESFLNSEGYEMIRYAADRGLYVHACTNGNVIDPEKLVASGIADIQFQIAGTDQATHAQYRVGGMLDQVLDNLRQTVKIRNQRRQDADRNPYPMRIGLGFILFRHNEHQQDEFFELAKSLGVDGSEIIDPCVRTVEQGKELLPTDREHWIYDPEAFENGKLAIRRPPRNSCDWIYSTTTIQVNGDVVPCCRDPKGKHVLGNVFEDHMDNIWNGDKYRHLRRGVARNQKGMKLCILCEGYSMPEVNK